MKKGLLKNMKKVLSAMIAALCLAMGLVGDAFAASSGLTISPMNQSIVLMPGDIYNATFTISNPVSSDSEAYYELSVEPFYLNDNNEATFGTAEKSNAIVDWITFISPKKGKLSPNQVEEVQFSINVPKTAPAGGQYASIMVTLNSVDSSDEVMNSGKDASAMIKEIKRVGHLVYAEVAGDSVKSGEILDASVTSFLLGGKITGSSSIRNTGNVHGIAKYKLQVYPLFSDEEIYTNEEQPEVQIIFPDRTVYSEIVWDETPPVGIFNVVYTAEFENATAEIKKMVIICPIWLLFIIIFAIIAIIMYFLIRSKNRKNGKKRSQAAKAE